MSAISTIKLQRVEATDKEDIKNGIVAFQLVKFIITFYGKKIEDVLDTKIMSNGKQIVIDGNGFVKSGYEL